MKKIALLFVCLLATLWLVACGEVGPQGPQGEPGATPTVTVSADGYWVINGEKTEHKAVGEDGTNGTNGTDGTTPTIEISADGYWVINGEKTEHKAVGEDGTNGTNGTDGTDGTTPTIEISTDGYWVINGEKTEHKAVGEDGTNGTNGANGTDGKTPTIEISADGYWVINGEKTEHKAVYEESVCEHTYSDYVEHCAATCVAWGVDVRRCSKCDAPEYQIVHPTGHSYENAVIAPTCKEEGYTNHSCLTCGYSYCDTFVAAIGEHVLEQVYVLTSTCAERWVLMNCSNCHQLFCVEEEPTVEHSYEERICADCGALLYSAGLEYSLLDDGTYEVAGIGTCKDTDIWIPSTYNGIAITGINATAFRNHTELVSVRFSEHIASIGNRLFFGCEKLMNISVDEHNAVFASMDGNLYAKDGKTFIQGAIGKTSISVASGVTAVAASACYGCPALTEVTIPSSVVTIGEYAFDACNKISKVTFEDSSELEILGASAFGSCHELTNITIPESVICVDAYAFHSCVKLSSVHIPGNVRTLGRSVFANCYNLVCITVDDTNTMYQSIDGNLYSKDGKTLIRYAAKSSAESFSVPEGVEVIDAYAFSHCKNLKTILLPESITSIGEYAFEGSENLESIIIPKSVTSIGEYAFDSSTVIYCEATEKPDGWSACWVVQGTPVAWGYVPQS